MTREGRLNAREWIGTDSESVKDDIDRLGTDAAQYQVDLSIDRRESGDDRWSFTEGDMIIAMEEYFAE